MSPPTSLVLPLERERERREGWREGVMGGMRMVGGGRGEGVMGGMGMVGGGRMYWYTLSHTVFL